MSDFSLNAMQTLKANKKSKLQKCAPEQFFKDSNKVGTALLESLVENDTEAFIEILDAYLQAKKAQVRKKKEIPRSTVQRALLKRGNPILKTIARIVHETVY